MGFGLDRRRSSVSPRRSAGIFLYRLRDGRPEVLLGHPGGPLFTRKDEGAWSALKGEIEPGEDPYLVARREFEEETGHSPPDASPIDLGEVTQRGGKVVIAWALEGDLDPALATSNTFELEWPPHSGRFAAFPEIDRVEWFDLATAGRKVNPAQVALLERLANALGD
jgi:predicted NUDIX family NTP pyrophosphohydrolase